MATTKHTCGGPHFGRRTDGCPRCEELKAGAEPVQQPWRNRKANAGPRPEDYCSCSHTPLGCKCDRCGRYPYCD